MTSSIVIAALIGLSVLVARATPLALAYLALLQSSPRQRVAILRALGAASPRPGDAVGKGAARTPSISP